jgi:hypothetical protein
MPDARPWPALQWPHNAAMTAAPSWHLFFILPNLCPKPPSAFATDFLAICSGKDPLLQLVANTAGDATSLAMLGKYRSWFGKPYVPGCVLVRSDAPDAVRQAETLRAFRNVCAAATITSCAARALTGGQWLPLYSDFFVFASHVADKSGWIQNMDGPVGGMNDDVENFVGQCGGQIDMPDAFSVGADPVLLKRLFAAWDLYCLKKQRRQELLPIFRSLEVAFHAARFPSDGLSSINDAGTRVGLWVSALEILAHPGAGGKADKEKVQTLLGQAKIHSKALKRRRYTVSHWKKTYTVALAGRIYDDLYAARNAFMHGNAVEGRDLQFRKSWKRPSLMRLAPLLYSLALRATLDRLMPKAPELIDVEDDFFGLGVIEKGLKTALRGGTEE